MIQTNPLKHCNGDQIISLQGLFDLLGFIPSSANGDVLTYQNISRASSPPAVMKVNKILDCWYDTGLKQGGNLNDFFKYYWPDKSPQQITDDLNHLSRSCERPLRKRRKKTAERLPEFHFDSAIPLGSDKRIGTYLKSIGITECIDLFIREVHYYSQNRSGQRKYYSAMGWKNDNGGWEVCSFNFRECIGNRGMTFRPLSSRLLFAFMDYPGYMRYRNQLGCPHASILLVNHPRFIKDAHIVAERFQSAKFFDVEPVLN